VGRGEERKRPLPGKPVGKKCEACQRIGERWVPLKKKSTIPIEGDKKEKVKKGYKDSPPRRCTDTGEGGGGEKKWSFNHRLRKKGEKAEVRTPAKRPSGPLGLTDSPKLKEKEPGQLVNQGTPHREKSQGKEPREGTLNVRSQQAQGLRRKTESIKEGKKKREETKSSLKTICP